MSQSPSTSPPVQPLYRWPVIIGATIAIWGGCTLAASFFGLRFGSADSFIPPQELREKYISRVELAESYLALSKLSTDYLSKSDVEKNYVHADKINSLYVPKAEHQQLQKRLDDLIEQVSAVPTPFKPLTKEMTERGVWNDERLGVSIRMAGFFGFASAYEVRFLLTLPDSAEHIEVITAPGPLPFWTFRKHNREFKLSVVKGIPTTFVIKEISADIRQ
ncbi:hypothetical protein ABVN18_16705 [Pseudomonas canadensis]|jgi:hypothetical protein|uniref:hypothetical protein n=1 Tax=Pseudomonas canadensis TaxID=915099 RepID=UPI000F04991F|nr:hypothetical protein [Pseudomonas canadensis]MCF5173026.1 hypothetical protein [Pseudomonas canadensis]WLH32529.1 hypothetical protein PSH56_12645 [Pseudomonas canadensis]